MTITLTELRQHLFKLADQVADTGEPLVIERRGVRLKLVREDAATSTSRLQKLKTQSLVQGMPLLPDESPATWNEWPGARVAEDPAPHVAAPPTPSRKRRGA
jgi:antitoxin (DNA-binding transcriptional repressor) of toxin-antitoxin stability system